MNWVIFPAVFLGSLCLFRGLDDYMQDGVKWYRLRVTKGIEKCEYCSGVGMVLRDKVVKQK